MAVLPAEASQTEDTMAGATSQTGNPWGTLEQGQNVVLEKGNDAFTGVVDDLTDDRNIVWITSFTGERRLFHVGDGYVLRLQRPGPSSVSPKGGS